MQWYCFIFPTYSVIMCSILLCIRRIHVVSSGLQYVWNISSLDRYHPFLLIGMWIQITASLNFFLEGKLGLINLLFSIVRVHYHFKLDFQKVDQHTGGKWLIHSIKHCTDNELQSLECHLPYQSDHFVCIYITVKLKISYHDSLSLYQIHHIEKMMHVKLCQFIPMFGSPSVVCTLDHDRLTSWLHFVL